MSINTISDQNTSKAVTGPDSFTQLQDKKTEGTKEAKKTTKGQGSSSAVSKTASAGAVYTEGDDKTLQNNVEDMGKEVSKEDTVYKKETQASDKDSAKSPEQMTEDDYRKLEEEGMSFEKFELERLDRMLARIKTQRDMERESVSDQKTKLVEETEAEQSMALNYSQNKELIDRLKASNIPVTKENVIRISDAEEKADTVLSMSDQAKYYLIKNRMEPTLDNIYKASYSASKAKADTVNESQWESVKPQAEKIIQDAGFPVNEDTLNSAKWLFGHNLGITENNLWASWDLNRMKSDLTKEDITDKITASLAQGDTKSPSLSFLAQGQTEQAIKNIDNISDAAIETAVLKRNDKEIEELSIRDLYKEQKQLEEGSTAGKAAGPAASASANSSSARAAVEAGANAVADASGNAARSDGTDNGFDIKTVTVRRRLEEIRLKMTTEAGAELSKRGFHIETDSLQKIVEGLKEVEDRYYRGLLKEGNVSESNENVEAVKASLQRMEELKSAPAALLGSTLHTWQQETADTLATTGNDYKRNAASQSYETLMTKPRSDMGDSIAKAFTNSDGLLSEVGLEATEANKRALRILGYNNMPVTAENIDLVKLHDAQVNNVMKSLHPSVAVEFIRKGINPVDMPIEELNDQINTMKEEMGISGEERFSKFLWKLEKNNGISEEEKKSFIGIYRLMNTVEKSDGAALGAVIKADQDLTLKNLLTAVRTKNSGGIEADIDDDFGTLTQYNTRNESITEQINTAYTKNSGTKAAYGKELLRELRENLSPEGLKNIGDPGTIENMPLEQLLEKVAEQKEDTDNSYYSEKLKEIKEAVGSGKEAENLLKAGEVPVTLTNLLSASDFLQKGNTVFHKLNNLLKRRENPSELAAGKNIEKEDGTDNSGNVAEDRELQGSDELKGAENTDAFLQEFSDKLIGSLEDSQKVMEAYTDMENNVLELLKGYYDKGNLTSKDIGELKRISNGMQFISRMASKENYQIPLMTAEGITSVNVTLLKNTGDTGKLAVSIPSDKLGQLELSLSVKNNEVSAFIACENRSGLDAVQNNDAELREAFASQDTKIRQINYGIGNSFNENGRYNNYKPKDEVEAADTKTLLKLAKTFILQIKNIENEY
ncbi:hypothetical protein SAMN02745136_04059 [Anaerocolumna jejuensis DSM 15929]|uniref:Flagellar hook-length control protein FliK n=1 Tax=Anaerocolumna jejuensis DSM 15929 TaxID=1121322 RepID=A0A1M6XTC0_9FIRM|nr:DUF6240 domain-containing protein [Anaerocolumna jejuensis]SHL09242.1 hypothetical protein SAMN02745136_04059 [Anaerocolumna jejuensis DSM 15929]